MPTNTLQESVYIFVDEYGTPSLQIEKEGTTTYFIYAAIVIPASELNIARALHQELLKTDFPSGYIKSSHIKNNDNGYVKAITALTKIKSLKHYVIALIVDKSRINIESGLSRKRVFIKYFQRLLSKSFLSSYDEIRIVVDKTGDAEFTDSLKRYMGKRAGIETTLFSNNSFSTADDITEEPLIQFADLYAGVLGRYYCGKYNNTQAKTVHEIIKTKLSVEWFPEDSMSLFAAENGFDDTFDNSLLKLSIETAKKYCDENEQNDKVGCELIRYLIQETKRNPKRHISSKEIKEYLTIRKFEIGDPIVKISELRDHGVIIISPIGKKGYKFPTNEKEIAEFFDRLQSNVIPQLRRCHIINDVLAKKSYGKYNVLKDGKYDKLNQLSELVNNG